MGLLNFFSKPAPDVLALPSGSLTVDREGSVFVGTLPSSFPGSLVEEIANKVFTTFREAATAQLPLSELVIQYPSLKITAREMRGGAVIYLFPKVSASPASKS